MMHPGFPLARSPLSYTQPNVPPFFLGALDHDATKPFLLAS
jgi:hypothetical protein